MSGYRRSEQPGWTRTEAIARLKTALTVSQVRDICGIIETAEVQGDYHFDGEGSTWQECATETLSQLADEFRRMKL